MFLHICWALIAAKWAAQMALEWLNQRYVQSHAAAPPPALAEIMSRETYGKSISYTLAKSRFEMIEMTWGAILLAAVLFSGVLPWFYHFFARTGGWPAWLGAAFLLAVGIALSVVDWPLEWHGQFHLEARFGFNTSTPGTWWMDRFKGMALAVALGLPLLALILKLAAWLGPMWWVWAWVCLAVFQLVMMVLAPVLILPLFNKFTPLPAGELRDTLFDLSRRAGFHARDIQMMDGSKRSLHSNAFFTGLGRFRKIVLFDTLVKQLNQAELESVLAHEIGHYKKGHIPKTLMLALGGWMAAFYLLAVLAKEDWFLRGFGFSAGEMAPAFLIFFMLSGVATFWLSPVFNVLSRRHEYEADAYAAGLMRQHQPLIAALRKLNEKNLSNLSPHPFYSGFYYSHPTLIEREEALARCAQEQ
ncbi:MAG TPA: M48 family metallopeptidase [Verrucomicrobiae bacterium]|jgi:STE24 endopeptidase